MECPECGRELNSLIEESLTSSKTLLIRQGEGSVKRIRAKNEYLCPTCRTTILYGKERAKEILGKPQLEQKIDEAIS